MSQPRDSQIAFDLHKQLSEEQKIFVKTRKLEGTHKIKHWVELLDRVAHLDEVVDEKAAKSWPPAAYLLIISGIGALVLSIILYNTGVTKEGNDALHWFLIFLGIASLIGAIVQVSVYSKLVESINMPNNFRLYSMPLLHILSGEAGENARLSLSLNFDAPLKGIYKTKGPRSDADYFEVCWLKAKTTFADGTVVELELADLTRRIVTSRYNARGKLKVKTKYKVTHKMSVELAVPKAHYKPKPEARGWLDVGDYYAFKLKAKEYERGLSAYTDMNPLLGLIAQVYAAIEPI